MKEHDFDTIWKEYIIPMRGQTLVGHSGQKNKIVNVNMMPVSPGASGMQPRDPFRLWRGTLASGHKPR